MFLDDIIRQIKTKIKSQQDIHVIGLLTKLLYLLEQNHEDSQLLRIRKAMKLIEHIKVVTPRPFTVFDFSVFTRYEETYFGELYGKAIHQDHHCNVMRMAQKEADFFH